MGVRYDATDKRFNDLEHIIKDLETAISMIATTYSRGIYHPAVPVLQKEVDRLKAKLARWREKEGVM